MKKMCSRCGKEKPLTKEYFQPRKESKDGFRGVCRGCQNLQRKTNDKIIITEKMCTKCKRIKPIEAFNKNINSKDNHHSICRECINSSYEIICEECGNAFKTHHKDSKFCSSECVAKNQQERVSFKCDFCGKGSWERLTEYNRYKNHYCSKECKDKHRSILYVGKNAPMYGKIGIRGEEHYRWNADLTKEEREIERNYPEYTQFIKDVYKRDNYTCQCCGKIGQGNLNVHHLDGYNWCKEKRTDMNNGITLCKNCHKSFHKLYGKGDNTKEQFEKFIKKDTVKKVSA